MVHLVDSRCAEPITHTLVGWLVLSEVFQCKQPQIIAENKSVAAVGNECDSYKCRTKEKNSDR